MPGQPTVDTRTWDDLVHGLAAAGLFSAHFERIVRYLAERASDPELHQMAVTTLVMRFRAPATPGGRRLSPPAGSVPALVRRCLSLPDDPAAQGLLAITRLDYGGALKALADIRGTGPVIATIVQLIRNPDTFDLVMLTDLLVGGVPFAHAETAAALVRRFDPRVPWARRYIMHATRRGDIAMCVGVFNAAVTVGLDGVETDLALHLASQGEVPSIAVDRARKLIAEQRKSQPQGFRVRLAGANPRDVTPEKVPLRLRSTDPVDDEQRPGLRRLLPPRRPAAIGNVTRRLVDPKRG